MDTDTAFADLCETIDFRSFPVSPDLFTFKARRVAGAHFSLLSLRRRDQIGGGYNASSSR